MILLNINWSRISCVWCYSCRWWAARCSELNFRCNNAFEAEYLFRWLSSHVCVSAVLTFSAGLHPWRRVDGVTEQTVTRHLQTHNSCTHRTCSTQRGRLTHLSLGKWGAPVPYTYFLLIRDFTYFIITFTVSLILVLFSQKQPAEKTIVQHQTRNHRSILTAASQLRYWWQI